MEAISTDNEAIKSDTTSIKQAIPALQDGVDGIRQDRLRETVLAWISSADFAAQQSDIMSKRQAESGLWFLKSPEFINWIQGPRKTLFCPGIPGAGKTTIAAIAIDYLMTIQSNSTGVAYLYCDYKSQTDQSATSLLAALLKQLLQAQPLIPEKIELLHAQHKERGTKPSLDELFSGLHLVAGDCSRTYIVVDALDECSDGGGRTKLLGALRDLQIQTNVCLMVTSRFIPDIESDFKSDPHLEIRASDADLKRFVAAQIYRLPKCIQRDAELQSLLESKIVEAADGM
jgi:hypothetical protein